MGDWGKPGLVSNLDDVIDVLSIRPPSANLLLRYRPSKRTLMIIHALRQPDGPVKGFDERPWRARMFPRRPADGLLRSPNWVQWIMLGRWRKISTQKPMLVWTD